MYPRAGDKNLTLIPGKMRPSFYPRLINGPFDDPGLFVPLTFRKRALLFDLGDLGSLSSGDILKTSHVFVTHTHMDHFVGFDQLLRRLLGRAINLHLFGPQGFLDNVAAKLKAYTWNLVHNYTQALVITATEIHNRQCITQTFQCREGFAPSIPRIIANNMAVVHQEPALSVSAAILDHQIPCLAFAIKEHFHINILRSQLEKLGLAVGPWINDFKALLFQQADPATEIQVPCAQPQGTTKAFTIAELSKKTTRITPGQKIAYVADAVYSAANEKKIITLAQGANHLFIEAAFLEADSDVAMAKYHLTAHQAGIIARKAKVREITIFHHSPRYTGQAHLLEEEARRAFEGRS